MKFGPGQKLSVAVILCLCLNASAQFGRGRIMFAGGGGPAGPGMVNLPYMAQDGAGNNYRIYNGGWFQQNNNMPLYSQGAMLYVNGQPAQQTVNQGRLDAKTGELVLEMGGNGCAVTRRVLIDKAGGYVRYIDVLKNTQAQQQTFQVMVQSSCNYGINAGQDVADPKKKDLTLGWVGQTGANQSVVEMFAGKGAKVAPTINWPQGNNQVQATVALTIGPGKEAAIMHLHCVAATQDQGMRFIVDFKEAPLIKAIPPAVRRLIVNFRSGQDFIGDLEILRGDVLDVVELRGGGDQFKGTLKETNFDLQTFYGNIALPVDRVIGIINVGQFRPRQLLVTVDGQIFGGYLKKQTIELQLSSGQVTQVPLSQIARVGYRKRADEPGEWTFEKPMVLMRSGDRVNIQMPTAPLDIVTRYGHLSLKPAEVASIALQNEDNQVHEIQLADGSKFAGLLTAESLEVKLDTGGSGTGTGAAAAAPEQVVKFPASAVARIQLNTKVREPDDTTPIIRLANEDELSGTLVGKLKLDTVFDTIDVNAPELRSLAHAPEGGAADVQAVLWDGTSLSGQLADQEVACQLMGGVTLKVPVALIREYTQPQPQPSAAMVERIKQIVQSDLANEDWHVRDRARSQLLAMGPGVASVLKQLHDAQPPEAQKTIDLILGELDKERKAVKTGGAGPAAPAPVGIQDQ